MIDPIPTPFTWPPTIALRRDPASILKHFEALCLVLAVEPPEVKRPERGIIYVGGGKYWPGIVVGVRMLRELGCTIPVQVWYRGDHEPINPADVEGLGVWLRDADRMARERKDNRVLSPNEFAGGWETKLYALTHTCFDQVLFLDADAYCVRDPSPLFDYLSPAEPFAFWSDLPRMESSVAWDRVYPHGPGGVPTVQGGQLLIDRRHGAKLVNAAHWMCQHSDYYFAHLYGDQDTWRVGLAAEACGWRCFGPADWEDVAFVCRDRGKPFIVHRCQAKLFRPADANGKPPERCDTLPSEGRVFWHFTDLLAG